MPKIVFFTTLSKNGVFRNRLTLASQFIHLGYDVEFLVPSDESPLRAEVPSGCPVISLGTSRPRQLIFRLGKYLRQEKPDAMIVSSWPNTGAAILARLFFAPKVRLLVSEHSSWPGAPELVLKDKIILKLFGKMLYSRADCVVGVSVGVADSVARFIRIDRDKLTVIHNPLRSRLEVRNPKNDQEVFTWWAGSKKILAIGRLAPAKDYSTMLESLAHLNKTIEAKLLVLGEGSQLDRLQDYAKELGIANKVRFIGFRVDPFPFYEMADLFVLSSINEGFGNVLIEALSMGVPVVSTDCPSGPSEILADGKWGTLVAMGDAQALACAMKDSLSTPKNEDKLRARAACFSVGQIANEYLAALNLK